MEIRLLLIDSDPAFLIDAKEFLDSTGRFKTDISMCAAAAGLELSGYDLVIADESAASLRARGNIVPMYPEYSVGKGFAKYSGKKGLLECIDSHFFRIRAQDGPKIIRFHSVAGPEKTRSVLRKIQKDIEVGDRSVLSVNFSYSLKGIAESKISASDFVFYITSEVEERESFISNILKSEKKYSHLTGFATVRELLEAEDGRLEQIIKGIKETIRHEYVFIYHEPGIRHSIWEGCDEADLNVLISSRDDGTAAELVRGAPESFRIMPLVTEVAPAVRHPADKRICLAHSHSGSGSFLRRIDRIFG